MCLQLSPEALRNFWFPQGRLREDMVPTYKYLKSYHVKEEIRICFTNYHSSRNRGSEYRGLSFGFRFIIYWLYDLGQIL